MRRIWLARRCLSALLLGLVGCTTPEPSLKPPLREEFTIPPTDDPRFSQPVSYPKETLNNFQQKREKDGGPPGDRFRGPSGGMGGPGNTRGY